MRRSALVGLALALGVGCGEVREPGPGSAHDRTRYRRAQRAYDGAPPVVPHAVAALGREDCLGCHGAGLDLGADGLAPRTPHPERVACRQCHVEQDRGRPALARNDFVGLRWPAQGARAYPGAPPALPHPRRGREECLGCHAETGGSPTRTPHPERVLCVQCHLEPATRLAEAGGGRQ